MERPRATDWLRGMRWMTTFRKLPNNSPNTPDAIVKMSLGVMVIVPGRRCFLLHHRIFHALLRGLALELLNVVFGQFAQVRLLILVERDFLPHPDRGLGVA